MKKTNDENLCILSFNFVAKKLRRNAMFKKILVLFFCVFFQVSGWALDDMEVVSVKIYRLEGDGKVYIGDAVFVEGARPDVEQAYPGYPNNNRAGILAFETLRKVHSVQRKASPLKQLIFQKFPLIIPNRCELKKDIIVKLNLKPFTRMKTVS
jgi:hypothetical protein